MARMTVGIIQTKIDGRNRTERAGGLRLALATLKKDMLTKEDTYSHVSICIGLFRVQWNA